MEKMEKLVEREVAWRIFAFEFNRSNLYISEGDERAPNYIITPTGVKCNRLFIIGVVTEVENLGKENNLWRARLADPTGVFTMYAGQYQPEAAIFLSELQVPAYVAVVGKARKYEPEDGSVYISVRPEEINTADEKLRDRWVLDTAERTLERIGIIKEALNSGLTGNELKEFLLKKGANAALAEGTVRAVEHYKNLDKIIEELKNALMHAVEAIASVKTGAKELQTSSDEIGSKQTQPEQKLEEINVAEAKAIEPKETEKELKDVVAGIIDKLDTGRGISYSAVVENAQSGGINAELVELSIKELMAEGRCYEPKIGVLRKVQE